jgi:ferredoxin
MPKIKFLVEHHEVEVNAGRTVREVAIEQSIDVDREFFRGFNCRGYGLCGTCKVWVKEAAKGATSQPNFRERFHGMGDGRRLACQTHVQGDIEVTSMPGGDDRIQQQRPIDPVPKSHD